MTFRRSRRLALIGVAAAALTLLATGWALATHFSGHVTSVGKAQVSQTNQSSTALTTITSTSFSTLNGTSTTVVVPTGQNRLVNARWVGETQAFNAACYMRIVALVSGGSVEFNPVSSFQALLVGPGNSSSAEIGSQAVERSRILGAGTYTVVAQLKKGASGGTCNVSEWHFAVQVIAT